MTEQFEQFIEYYKNGTEKQRAQLSAQVRAVFYEDKTVDELLIVYANNKHEREEIRMHLHLRLMYKPHEMYGDAMRAMDAIGE